MPAPSSSRTYTPWSEVPSRSLRDFLRTETGSAGLLLAATLIALIWANSPFGDSYGRSLAHAARAHPRIEHLGGSRPGALGERRPHGLVLLHRGPGDPPRTVPRRAARPPRAAVPAIAALAGMAVPALLYTAVNAGGPGAHGWGIVMATDIGVRARHPCAPGKPDPRGVWGVPADAGHRRRHRRDHRDRRLLLQGHRARLACGRRSHHRARVARPAGGPCLARPQLLRGGPDPLVRDAPLGRAPHDRGCGDGPAHGRAPHAPGRCGSGPASVTRLFRRAPSPKAGRAAVLEIGGAVSANERFQQSIHPWTSYLVVPIFALATRACRSAARRSLRRPAPRSPSA